MDDELGFGMETRFDANIGASASAGDADPDTVDNGWDDFHPNPLVNPLDKSRHSNETSSRENSAQLRSLSTSNIATEAAFDFSDLKEVTESGDPFAFGVTREELLQLQEDIPDEPLSINSHLNKAHITRPFQSDASVVNTEDVATQTDAIVIDNLPSQFAAKQRQEESHRPKTAGRRLSNLRHRRESQWKTKNNKVAPISDAALLELDAPKRLQVRHNVRKALGAWKLFWYDLKRWWHLKKTKRRDPIPIWSTSIKRIEGSFGSGLGSFFSFLRWLFLLNMFISVMYVCFVILPMAIRFDYDSITEKFSWHNIIDGAGAAGETWMFYGGYSLIDGYHMDLAYVFVPLSLITLTFFVIIRSAARTTESKSLVKIDAKYPFGLIVLASWDYSINQGSGIENLKNGIVNAIRDAIAENKARDQLNKLQEATLKQRLIFLSRHIAAWILWMMLVAGSFTAIWFIILEQRAESVGSEFFATYAPVLVLSFINGALPLVVTRLTRIDNFKHPRTASQVTTIRIFLLRIMTIYALLYGFFRKTNLIESDTSPTNTTILEGSLFLQDDCAGTVIGKEIYKLVLVDTVVGMIQRLAATLFWFYWLKRRIELDLVQCVLHMVYRQGLVWIGMSFAPVVPILAALSNILYFYFYVGLVRGFCRPPQTRWDSSRNTAFFLWCLAATLFFMAIPLAWALTEYNPNCGPYGSSSYSSWFDGIRVWIRNAEGPLRGFFSILFNPVFMFGIFLALCLWISLLNIRVHNIRRVVREQTWELEQTREDKKALMVAVRTQGGRNHLVGESLA